MVMDYGRYKDNQVRIGGIAAFIGGFSLSASNGNDMENTVEVVAWVLAIIAVHACTCAALTSAFLYRALSVEADEKACAWAEDHPWLLQLPFLKFAMGVVCYLTSVVLMSYSKSSVNDQPVARFITTFMGIMSIMMAAGTASMVYFDPPSKHKGTEKPFGEAAFGE